jgi:putative methionine-R-sulfoxide reductase with GAF domain
VAVPVADTKALTITAVVYLDSKQTDFFTPELRQVILEACVGITSYVNEVYE